MEKSILHKLPSELRLKIFEYALEEFKSTKERHPPTYAKLLCDPPFRAVSKSRFRLQKNGLLAGLACGRDLYNDALCVYYEKNIFKLTLRNWKLVSCKKGVSTKAIQSIRHLQIQLFDGNISPTDAPKCMQFPWTVLSTYIACDLFKLLTSRRSRLSEATSLQTLEIFAEGVKLASKVIDRVVNLFLKGSPKIRKVVVKFPLHEMRRQQVATLRQMIDYCHNDDDDENIFSMTIPPAITLDLLSGKLGKASCVRWEGHPANLIGTATWQAKKGKFLTESKTLERFQGESQSCGGVIEETLSAMKRDSEENVAASINLSLRLVVMQTLARFPPSTWSDLPQLEKDQFEENVQFGLAPFL
ncbi:hypothetical protein N431DRAFT_477049 [Stipitochalara longipes BDJ]|nr:hypothetical protein N431DRAFT_477049 [Stipitochalara longipes BDJ]